MDGLIVCFWLCSHDGEPVYSSICILTIKMTAGAANTCGRCTISLPRKGPAHGARPPCQFPGIKGGLLMLVGRHQQSDERPKHHHVRSRLIYVHALTSFLFGERGEPITLEEPCPLYKLNDNIILDFGNKAGLTSVRLFVFHMGMLPSGPPGPSAIQ